MKENTPCASTWNRCTRISSTARLPHNLSWAEAVELVEHLGSSQLQLPLARCQVIVNGAGGTAACSHGEDHGGRSGDNVASGKNTRARGALGFGIRLDVTALVGLLTPSGIKCPFSTEVVYIDRPLDLKENLLHLLESRLDGIPFLEHVC